MLPAHTDQYLEHKDQRNIIFIKPVKNNTRNGGNDHGAHVGHLLSMRLLNGAASMTPTMLAACPTAKYNPLNTNDTPKGIRFA